MSTTKNGITLTSYLVGLVFSAALTLEAYLLTKHYALSKWPLIFVLGMLAVIQLIVQLYFFLHLAYESKPRWRLLTFVFAAMVVSIVVFGSFWIMSNLNYHHQHLPGDIDSHIMHDEGIQ